MPELRANLACIPCAKRKVRCDREAPSCSNCKRRKGDSCHYPATQTPTRERSSLDDTTNAILFDRVKRLENHVRSMSESRYASPAAQSDVATESSQWQTANHPSASQLSFSDTPQPPIGFDPVSGSVKQPSLIVKDKQSIYVESPMWYTWSEANSRLTGQEDPGDRDGFFDTSGADALLGQIQLRLDEPVYQHHPAPSVILEIWEIYLRNVHPLTMMFVSWDKHAFVRKLATDPGRTKEEHAFLYAIYFITSLTIDEEDCTRLWKEEKKPLLNRLQQLVEQTLLAAGFASTNDRILLHAFMMYMLAMRNRARPNTLYSLSGVAIRIAERMGLHRDGTFFRLSPFEAEERRRTWWQLQHIDILVGLLAGCVPLSLTAAWDTKMPANLDESDILRDRELPPEKSYLTSMSAVLCQYTFLQARRSQLGVPQLGFAPLFIRSPEQREREYEAVESLFRTKFLQFCEPLEPLHIYVQISVRCVLMAYRRTLDQPRVTDNKLSDMTMEGRDTFLKTCIKCLEYNVMLFTKEEITGFRWQAENYFQWTAFVYVLIEAHQRASDSTWSRQIWDLTARIYNGHPEFARNASEKKLILSFGRMVLGAWKPYYEHLKSLPGSNPIEIPWYIEELRKQLLSTRSSTKDGDDVTEATEDCTPEESLLLYQETSGHCLGFVGGFNPTTGDEMWDLNVIDWSFWESLGGQMF